ncbi:hypothetical protein LAV_00191 [Sphingobium phage Lacusarx]|uniref:Uncharacterized protein n=1 Tax=Sphingobium phage Lacusarx TaxID=1980139 RepID=A0A1W6DXH8_9CAUD|nr:hypothetical protein FDH44_gp112 [Sphingobium phage Lacusarx]ARK07566.1 hypothetical protein LAV_00191 [Sphingobium phage Lacusarx]
MTTRRQRQIRSDGVQAPLVPKDGWSDGIHFVRPATAKDRHKMRWVMGAHKESGAPTKKRHVPTKEEAISVAQEYTARWLGEAPAASTFLASEPEKPALRVPPPPFATTYFDCICANPIAQVWQCNGVVGEKGNIGRRTKEGRPNQQTAIPHAPGECAVMIGDEVVRNADDSIRVFPTWLSAEEYALHLYEEADEEERILWRPGDMKVGGTHHIDIIFDPGINGRTKPFSLYLPEFRRPVYEDRTKMVEPPEFFGTKEEIAEYRRQWRIMNRVPTFEERPLRFRMITGALESAEERERMIGGIV